MGGTSTDVSAVTSGKPHLTQEFAIDGLPIRVPIIDIHTIGAGGGSIVWVDEGGMLRVGPHSAGAVPGPACYMRGGTEPTLTDAHMICQTIRPETFLGGRMKIDPELSRRAFLPIAETFGMSLEEAAGSAIRLADANITRAIQLISTERGLDPRDYVLVPFGGAGPLHAARVAEELGIDRVVVPPSAGVISAYGLIASDFAQHSSLTRRGPVDGGAADALRAAFAAMKEEALARARAMRLEGDLRLEFTAEMRFVGQAFEVPVPFDPAELDRLTAEDVARRFAEAHHRVYFFGGEASRPVEFVSFRLGVTAPLAELPLLAETAAGPPRDEQIELFFRGRRIRGRLVGRAAVGEGEAVPGPALLEDPTSTVFVPDGWSARRDANDNTIMQRERSHA
jgi:N-methylhydantoinase A